MQLQTEKFLIMQQNATFIQHLKGLIAKGQPQGWIECLLGIWWCEGCSRVSLYLNWFRCQIVFSKHLSPFDYNQISEVHRKHMLFHYSLSCLFHIFFHCFHFISFLWHRISTVLMWNMYLQYILCTQSHVRDLTLCLPFFRERDLAPFSGSVSTISEWGLNISNQQE